MAYQPIEDYGIIGNMHTTALVGKNGSIDWFCFPHFDSPSIFASILDDKKGGFYRIAPVDEDATTKQIYWPDTNVLITRFFTDHAVSEVIDYMPVGLKEGDKGFHQLIRTVKVVKGTMKFKIECYPAFDYGRADHTIEMNEFGANFHTNELSMQLATTIPLHQETGGLSGEFTLNENESTTFALRRILNGIKTDPLFTQEESFELFEKTIKYWRKWLSKCTYSGRWREIVHRSALVLKLLTFRPTGAIIAAPTTSLPENIGGGRNWDYRYTWVRDSAFVLYALMRIGFTEEAEGFMKWIEDRCHEIHPDGSLAIMYTIDGKNNLKEEELSHLDGYRGSKPVRIGNGAAEQLQLDIYGELLDAVYLYNKYGNPISYDLWIHLRRLINFVCDNWQQKDEGVWEVRGGKQHFVFSKLMCWVALDRGIRLADKRSFPADREKWSKVRDQIYEEIMTKGWNKELKAFVQYYNSDTLDASILLMPLVFFVSPQDPRMLSTLEQIMKSPDQGGLVSNSLVYRYDYRTQLDGFHHEEGTFNICTFWLVEALTRAGKLREARLMFEQILGYSNHLGLFAEETGPRGEALGNFPQAFTHLALISAAFNLDRALGKGW